MYFDHKSGPVALKSCPKDPNFCMLKGGGISIWVYGYYEHTKNDRKACVAVLLQFDYLFL